MTERKRVKQGDKINLEVEATRGEVTGEITRTGSSFALTIPSVLMEHKGGFVNRAGVFSKIPIVDRKTGRRGFIMWYKLPESLLASKNRKTLIEEPKEPRKHFMEFLPRADSIEAELTGVMSAVISAEKLKEKVATGDSKKAKEPPKVHVKPPEPVTPEPTPPPKEVKKPSKKQIKSKAVKEKVKTEKDVIAGLLEDSK